MNVERRKKILNITVIVVNIMLILCLIIIFIKYDNIYKQKLFNQNIDDITNINQSAANISSSFFNSSEAKLLDLALFIEQKDLSVNEAMEYIYDSNSDSNKSFEIIGSDCKGYRIEKDENGEYIPLDYSSGYTNIIKMIDKNVKNKKYDTVSFSSEFTDAYTAIKSFALYICVEMKNENNIRDTYTLMLVADTTDFADLININSGYKELSTVIMNESGDYIISNRSFKSNNFYKFLYVFNNLSLDQQNEIKRQVILNKKGTLKYKDSNNEKNVFVYTKMKDKDWYSVSSVPINKFHNRSFDISFTVVIVAILLLLLVIDLLYLSILNKRLKNSVNNEKIANAAKTDFLSRMSHDIRTPLNVIIGMSILARNENNPLETQDCLKNIDESGKFLLGLVNDILDLNKVESGKMEIHPEPYSYSEFCEHIKAVITPLCESKGINFEMVGNMPKDVYVMLDRLRVNQIFFNLLSNASKFTPSGGLIKLICRAKDIDKERVAFDFEVRDNGIGMSKEFQQHMFEAFSQEERKETSAIQGTGLGLAIVVNLVNMMNGSLKVESEIDKGTSFYVHIETCYAKEQCVKNEIKSSEGVLNGKRILLCEDHPLNAKIATKILEKKNVMVEHAENGSIGLSMFSSNEENYYDAILMDIRMPIMDGLETTRKIREIEREDAKEIPIIAMTANAYDFDKKNSYDAGMNAHIAKPVDPDILYETLEIQITNRYNK